MPGRPQLRWNTGSGIAYPGTVGGGPIAMRGGAPALTTIVTSNPISVTLTGSQQPQTNDVLVIIHYNDFFLFTDMPTPTVAGSTTGVNAISGGSADGGSNLAHIKTYTYVVGSTGDLTVSVTETGTANEDKALAVYVLSGVNTASPVDAAQGTISAGLEDPWVCTGLTATENDDYLIGHVNSGGGTDQHPTTPPGGMTETYDQFSAFMNDDGVVQQLSASGATGTRSFDPAGSANWAGVLIAMRTA